MGVNRSPTVLQQWRQTSCSTTAECTNNSTSVKRQWTWRILARPWARLVPQLYVLYYWWRHSLMHHKKTDTAYEETVDVKWLFTWLGLSARIISVIYWTMTFCSRRQAQCLPTCGDYKLGGNTARVLPFQVHLWWPLLLWIHYSCPLCLRRRRIIWQEMRNHKKSKHAYFIVMEWKLFQVTYNMPWRIIIPSFESARRLASSSRFDATASLSKGQNTWD